MTWLGNNWVIVVAGLAIVAFHFLGHRGHGGHGGGSHGRHGGRRQAPPATPPDTGQATLPQSGAPAVPTATGPATSGEPPTRPHSHGGGRC